MKVLVAFALILGSFVASPVAYTVVTGDYPGSSLFYGLEEDSTVVDQVLDVHDWLRG